MRERRKDMLKDKEKKKREIIILKNEEKQNYGGGNTGTAIGRKTGKKFKLKKRKE